MNQNIVNQLNIDLPPPVPGKRSVLEEEEEDEEERVSRESQARRLVNVTRDCGPDLERVMSKAMLDILQSSVYNGLSLDGSTACLGRTLCQGEKSERSEICWRVECSSGGRGRKRGNCLDFGDRGPGILSAGGSQLGLPNIPGPPD